MIMFRNWTFGRKVGGGFAITVLALIIIAITGFRSARSLIANDELVAHTHLVRRHIAQVLAASVEAESGVRGYALTGTDTFLEPYTTALTLIENEYNELRRLVSDNPDQVRRLEGVRTAIDARLAHAKHLLELRRTGTLETTAAAVATGEGKTAMDRLRTVMTEMDHEEANLLEIRRHAAEAATEVTKLVLLWGSIAAVFVTIVVGWLLTTSLSGQIGSAVRHIQSSSTELQAAANQQATGAREQATAMTEIATTINELLATSRQIAESAQRVAQIAQETAGAARTGDQTVQRSLEMTGALRRQVDQIVSHMLELGKKSQQIGSILEIIDELAEQTNILSINATIEAAGAGEAGKRFSVVADEIRKLADRVGTSSKEIRSLIDEIRAAVNTSVMATETGSKTVDATSRQFNDVAASLKHIAGLVGTTAEAAREIELSTKQQTTAVEQINVAISNVAQATKENETSARQTLKTASILTTLSGDLSKLVKKAA
jgi:CHASE3 domain sensor protein